MRMDLAHMRRTRMDLVRMRFLVPNVGSGSLDRRTTALLLQLALFTKIYHRGEEKKYIYCKIINKGSYCWDSFRRNIGEHKWIQPVHHDKRRHNGPSRSSWPAPHGSPLEPREWSMQLTLMFSPLPCTISFTGVRLFVREKVHMLVQDKRWNDPYDSLAIYMCNNGS